MVIMKTTRWLNEEEFRELLKISDYVGYREGEGGVFEFNPSKALRNNYSYEDICALIKELDLHVDEKDLDRIKQILWSTSIRVDWDSLTGSVKVTIPWIIFEKFKPILRELKGVFHSKNNESITYRILPFNTKEFIDKTRAMNIAINDPLKLFEDKPLPLNVELKNIVLRDYQVEALNKWVENNYQGIIALPTGSGKTVIAIASLTKKPVRTLIVVYTKEQMLQWRDSIIKYTNIEPRLIGLIYSEEKRLAPITITTYQSGFRAINEISPYFTMLIVDEVHHLPAEKFKHIVQHSLAKYKLGLSATPVREDNKHVELFPLMGGIIYYKTPAELVEKGYLAKYRVVTIKVKLTREEWMKLLELRRNYRKLIGSKNFEEVVEEAKRGDARAAEALKIHSEMRMLLAKAKAKIEAAVKIAKLEFEKGSKIIIFTQFVDQAREISRILDAYLITGETDTDDRKKALVNFKNNPRGILVVTTVGDEGLDIPDANVGIIVSGTGSRRQFIQRLGRLLRPKKDGSEAVLYEIVLEKTPEEYQAMRRKRGFFQ
ncbi:MAG: DEAD/DEAH box helicase [Desulfurococcaceae archaeon]